MATSTARKNDFKEYESIIRESTAVECNPSEFNIPSIQKHWKKVPLVRNLEEQILKKVTKCPTSFHMAMFHGVLDEGEPADSFEDDHGFLVGRSDLRYDPIHSSEPAREVTKQLEKARECGTTHCLAGWAVVLAGPEGLKLEKLIGTVNAGAAIYARSIGYVPDFYEGESDVALHELKQRIASRKRMRSRKVAKKAMKKKAK